MKRILLLLVLVAAVSCSPKTYTIIQVADAQLGFDAAVKTGTPGPGYVNDLTYEIECLKATVAKINEIKPDAVVFTGDQVHLPTDVEQWDAFMEIIAGIDPSIVQYHLPGNHDHVLSGGTADPTDFIHRFGSDRFVVKEEGLNLIGLNTSLIYFNSDMEQEQLEWLESILESTDKDDVTLVFGHHPYFCENIDEEDTHVQIPKSKRYEYFNLFVEKGVDAVFAGHLHESAAGEYKGIPMLTTTSSGYQLGDESPSVRLITVTGNKVKEEFIIVK